MKMNEIIQPRIYVDMDGVLCDFDGDFHKYNNDIGKLASSGDSAVEDYFANLKMLDDGHRLLRYLINNNLKFKILSAPLRHERRDSSIRGKRRWLNQHLNSHLHTAIFDNQKYDHCKSGDILIDDMVKNIEPWIKCGGIGILHRNYNDTIRTLKSALRA